MSLKGLGIPLGESRLPWRNHVAFAVFLIAWAAAFGYWLLPWTVEAQNYAHDHWFGWDGFVRTATWVLIGVFVPVFPLSSGIGRRAAVVLSLILMAVAIAAYELSKG